MMCTISQERIAFCAQVEGTQGKIFTVSVIALKSHITGKEEIAFCAQVEGMRGEIFIESPVALQS
jgi:hypothetical protein